MFQTFTKYAGFSDQNDRIYATESGHLMVRNARPSDSGTYTCAAINSITSVFRQAILIVTDKRKYLSVISEAHFHS